MCSPLFPGPLPQISNPLFLPPAQGSYSGTPPQVSPVGSSEFAQPTCWGDPSPHPLPGLHACLCLLSLPGTRDLQTLSDVPEAGATRRSPPHGLFTRAAQGGEGADETPESVCVCVLACLHRGSQVLLRPLGTDRVRRRKVAWGGGVCNAPSPLLLGLKGSTSSLTVHQVLGSDEHE